LAPLRIAVDGAGTAAIEGYIEQRSGSMPKYSIFGKF
jgi:hypothetical protein